MVISAADINSAVLKQLSQDFLQVHQGFIHTAVEMVAAAQKILNLATRQSSGSEDASAKTMPWAAETYLLASKHL